MSYERPMENNDPRHYFATQQEADEWLDFETDDEELEFKFYKENDRYEEWLRWRKQWEMSMV